LFEVQLFQWVLQRLGAYDAAFARRPLGFIISVDSRALYRNPYKSLPEKTIAADGLGAASNPARPAVPV